MKRNLELDLQVFISRGGVSSDSTNQDRWYRSRNGQEGMISSRDIFNFRSWYYQNQGEDLGGLMRTSVLGKGIRMEQIYRCEFLSLCSSDWWKSSDSSRETCSNGRVSRPHQSLRYHWHIQYSETAIGVTCFPQPSPRALNLLSITFILLSTPCGQPVWVSWGGRCLNLNL